jgi:hypothetical protein
MESARQKWYGNRTAALRHNEEQDMYKLLLIVWAAGMVSCFNTMDINGEKVSTGDNSQFELVTEKKVLNKTAWRTSDEYGYQQEVIFLDDKKMTWGNMNNGTWDVSRYVPQKYYLTAGLLFRGNGSGFTQYTISMSADHKTLSLNPQNNAYYGDGNVFYKTDFPDGIFSRVITADTLSGTTWLWSAQQQYQGSGDLYLEEITFHNNTHLSWRMYNRIGMEGTEAYQWNDRYSNASYAITDNRLTISLEWGGEESRDLIMPDNNTLLVIYPNSNGGMQFIKQ